MSPRDEVTLVSDGFEDRILKVRIETISKLKQIEAAHKRTANAKLRFP